MALRAVLLMQFSMLLEALLQSSSNKSAGTPANRLPRRYDLTRIFIRFGYLSLALKAKVIRTASASTEPRKKLRWPESSITIPSKR